METITGILSPKYEGDVIMNHVLEVVDEVGREAHPRRGGMRFSIAASAAMSNNTTPAADGTDVPPVTTRRV